MTTRKILKQWFSRGKKPTASQFAELFDSFLHKTDDRLEMTDINGLVQTLNEKVDTSFLDQKADRTELDAKAGINHRHNATDIDNLPTLTIDTILDEDSTNAVSNQTITQAINGKADTTHHHETGDITGLGDLLAGKADIAHTHTSADIDGLQTAIDEAITGKTGTPIVIQTGDAVIQPNVLNVWQTAVTSLTITKGTDIDGELNHYFVRFKAGANTTITFEGFALQWYAVDAPTWINGKTYEVSIINNLALWAEF